MKFFLSLLFVLFIFNPYLGFAQTEVLENLPIADPAATSSPDLINNNTDILAVLSEKEEGYRKVKDNFFSRQTVDNKKAFDQAAVSWAKDLVSAQLEFIRQQEMAFGPSLESNPFVPKDWLSQEKEDLENILNDLDNSSTYASANLLLKKASSVWSRVDKKINQARVFIVYNRLFALLNKARDIHDNIGDEQSYIKSHMVDSEKSIWDEWELVYSTYTEKLSDIDKVLEGIFGNFDNLLNWKGLDEKDSLWQNKLKKLDEALLDFESLRVLQAKVVENYYKVMDNLVPVKKPGQP